MAIPPPPPGFRIVNGGGGMPAPGGRPVLRRGRAPQAKVVQDGFVIDPNTGTAVPVAGLPPKSPAKRSAQAIPGRPGWFMDENGNAFQPKGLPDQAGPQNTQATAQELRNVIDAAFRAKELSREGWLATGLGSGIAQRIGGTSAAAVKGKLDTIGANTAFEQLQKMRAASPTGGALGSITERELDLLKSTIASLDPAQPDDEFQGAMQQIAESYGRVLMKIPGGRAMMIERGWLPKSGGGKKPPAKPQKPAKGRVINFDDLPE